MRKPFLDASSNHTSSPEAKTSNCRALDAYVVLKGHVVLRKPEQRPIHGRPSIQTGQRPFHHIPVVGRPAMCPVPLKVSVSMKATKTCCVAV